MTMPRTEWIDSMPEKPQSFPPVRDIPENKHVEDIWKQLDEFYDHENEYKEGRFISKGKILETPSDVILFLIETYKQHCMQVMVKSDSVDTTIKKRQQMLITEWFKMIQSSINTIKLLDKNIDQSKDTISFIKKMTGNLREIHTLLRDVK